MGKCPGYGQKIRFQGWFDGRCIGYIIYWSGTIAPFHVGYPFSALVKFYD